MKFLIIAVLMSFTFISCQKKRCWVCHDKNIDGTVDTVSRCDMTKKDLEKLYGTSNHPPQVYVIEYDCN